MKNNKKGFTPLEVKNSATYRGDNGKSLAKVRTIARRDLLTGFTVVELFFWVAILAFIIGGFAYKNSKEFLKPLDEKKIEEEKSDKGAVERLRIKDAQNDRYLKSQ